VQPLFDQAANGRTGLTEQQQAAFHRRQQSASREYAASGITFELRPAQPAFLREQGHSIIPDRFLSAGAINVFVTDALGYDIDRHRTGGVSIGPHPQRSNKPANRHFIVFLGLRDAGEHTLAHEYAHHFLLDTQRQATAARNFWSDLHIDWLLWRQRRGASIQAFLACRNSPFARPAVRGTLS
jgi:hypothetical protein